MACTGISASWCPECGDCTCPYDEFGFIGDRDTPGCPLHDPNSPHAERKFYCGLEQAESMPPVVMHKPAPVGARGEG
jgi:hypothetical protein